MSLTPEQILALAPDPASAKSGSGQASASYWSGLGGNAAALWGLCQGSGKEPYRTQIELAGPAFKCSCPSRKFPCKHGIGLYLLFARQAALFGSYEPPEWVTEWLQSREQRSEKKAAKAAEAVEQDAALNPEQLAARDKAQQKRQDKRAQNVAQGVALLDTWLQDLAREGLAGLKSKPAREFEAMAARMVDAQAQGLGTRIRKAASLIYANKDPHWELAVGRELAQLALLSQCHARLEQFATPLQTDIRNAIGWSTTQEEALAEAPLTDVWQVCGNQSQSDDRISRRACYLRGQNSGRWAMLLHFAAGGQSLPPLMLPGASYSGKLHFYPSATPLRAVLGDDVQAGETPATQLPSPAHPQPQSGQQLGSPLESQLHAQLEHFASLLAGNPLLEHYPMLLPDVTLIHHQGEHWQLRSGDGSALPLAPAFAQTWLLLALCGGKPATVFGLWDGAALLPLTVSTPHRLHSFDLEIA
jgi:hypothetical protein